MRATKGATACWSCSVTACGKHGYAVEAGKALHEVNPEDYAALILPGGKARSKSAAARGGFAPRLAARQDECGVVLGIHLVQRLAGFDRVAVLAASRDRAAPTGSGAFRGTHDGGNVSRAAGAARPARPGDELGGGTPGR